MTKPKEKGALSIIPLDVGWVEPSYALLKSQIASNAFEPKPKLRSLESHAKEIERNRGWLALDSSNLICGYILTSIVEAPQVYDPGGSTLYVQELIYSGCPGDNEIVKELLLTADSAVIAEAQHVLTLVNAFNWQPTLGQYLVGLGLRSTTRWRYVKILDTITEKSESRRADLSDLEALVELICQRYREYERARPDFWRRSADHRNVLRTYLSDILGSRTTIARIYFEGPKPTGCIIGTIRTDHPIVNLKRYCEIDDFFVLNPERWSTVGKDLILGCLSTIKEQGMNDAIITSAVHDIAKNSIIECYSSSVINTWYANKSNTLKL